MNAKLKSLSIKRDRRGDVLELTATYVGLPARTWVRLQLHNVGALLGTTIAEGRTDENGEIVLKSRDAMARSSSWIQPKVALRLVAAEEWKRYEVFHVRPMYVEGWRYLLWWANPFHALEYFVLDREKYWVNICSTQLD